MGLPVWDTPGPCINKYGPFDREGIIQLEQHLFGDGPFCSLTLCRYFICVDGF